MTARAYATEFVVPMGGELVNRIEHGFDVVEIYAYPSSADFDAIKAAWHSAPRRPRTLVMSVTIYKQSAGRLFVSVRCYVEPTKAPVHIDEPIV